MPPVHSQLAKDFPEKSAQLNKLCQDNPAFALKTDEYEAVSLRISSESLDAAALDALKHKQATLKNDIARQLKHSSGSCCGGCGG